KGTLTTMERKMADQERLLKDQAGQLKSIQDSTEKFVEFSKKAEERAYVKALSELKAKQRDAVEAHDTETFDKVSQQLDEHIKQNPALTTETKPAADTDKRPPEGSQTG